MKTKVTGYLTQKHGFYYVVLNLPTDEKGKRNRKTLSTGLSTDRNATKAKALLLTMIREANAGEEVRGVNERQPKSQNKTEDERWNSPWPGREIQEREFMPQTPVVFGRPLYLDLREYPSEKMVC